MHQTSNTTYLENRNIQPYQIIMAIDGTKTPELVTDIMNGQDNICIPRHTSIEYERF